VRNRWVNFKIKHVCVPDPDQILMELYWPNLRARIPEILMELHGDDLLQGKIIDASDSDCHENAFAVVEVEGLARPLVVPMNRTQRTNL